VGDKCVWVTYLRMHLVLTGACQPEAVLHGNCDVQHAAPRLSILCIHLPLSALSALQNLHAWKRSTQCSAWLTWECRAARLRGGVFPACALTEPLGSS
jgi:hypothetical protein